MGPASDRPDATGLTVSTDTPGHAAGPALGPADHGPRDRALLGQLSDMDLRLLRVFRAVVDCGGLSAAELELNIGASTVSRHLKDL